MYARQTLMNAAHPRWQEFCARLYELQPNRCDHTTRVTRRILEAFDLDVEGSLEFFEREGGFCDCEVILNVIASTEGKIGAAS